MEGRQVKHLLHVNIGGTRNIPHAIGNLLRDRVVAADVRPISWISMGAGNPKFKICVTMSAGWKKNSTPGNCRGKSSRKLPDVIRRRMMMLLIQAHQNLRVAGADHAGVGVGQINAGVGKPDVVENRISSSLGICCRR